MKSFLIPLQTLALLGFLLSLAVHISSVLGFKLFAGAELLHLGVFVVFLPACLIHRTLFFNLRKNQKEAWKILLKGCPPWMLQLLIIVIIYAILNFIYFMANAPAGTAATKNSNGVLSPMMLRGFSGHWMVFYWASYTLLYSASHQK